MSTSHYIFGLKCPCCGTDASLFGPIIRYSWIRCPRCSLLLYHATESLPDSLDALIMRSGPITPSQAKRFLEVLYTQILRAVASGQDTVGISPQTIVVFKDETIAVVPVLPDISQDGSAIWCQQHPHYESFTVNYLAPEEFLVANEHDERSTVYMLACIFIFIVTGRSPFEECNVAQQYVDKTLLPNEFRLPLDIPSALRPVLAMATAPKKTDRFGNVTSFLSAITAALNIDE